MKTCLISSFTGMFIAITISAIHFVTTLTFHFWLPINLSVNFAQLEKSNRHIISTYFLSSVTGL